TLLSGGADGVLLWEVATGKELRRIEARRDGKLGEKGDLFYLLAPGGRHLVAASWSAGALCAVETASGKEVAGAWGRAGCCTADGAAFAGYRAEVVGKEARTTVRLRDLRTAQEKRAITFPGRDDLLLAVSPDAKVVAMAARPTGQLSLRDLTSGH